jgi:carboxynorspermidine decarboxylase
MQNNSQPIANMTQIPNPCYVMEESRLRQNLSLIQQVAQQSGVNIILAFKAFALWKSFPIFREYIHETTASSLYEARLAFEEFGSRAHTYSPAYEDESIEEIIACSSHLVFNSMSQYTRFMPYVNSHNAQASPQLQTSVGLRVNPEYSEIETLLYNPCAPGSRFGILASDLPETLPRGVEGFHIHAHCESGSDAFARTLQHIEAKFSSWFPQLQWINFGGGHLMTRADYDVALLIRTLKDFKARYPWLQVVLEPGSAFAWQTGYLKARVVDIVVNNGVQTAILNVSFTCHMPDCLEMPYTPAIRGAEIMPMESSASVDALNQHIYRLGGHSCLSGDYMGSWKFNHALEIGEEVIFEDMIHYTTVKTNMFNGVAHPSIGLQHEDRSFELYRSFGYEDYRDRMC